MFEHCGQFEVAELNVIFSCFPNNLRYPLRIPKNNNRSNYYSFRQRCRAKLFSLFKCVKTTNFVVKAASLTVTLTVFLKEKITEFSLISRKFWKLSVFLIFFSKKFSFPSIISIFRFFPRFFFGNRFQPLD